MPGFKFRRILSCAVLGAGLSIAGGLAARACDQVHIVRHGDTLGEIARHYLGTIAALPVLHNLNRSVIGPNAHRLEIGQALTIPCTDKVAPSWAALVTPQTLHRLTDRDGDIQIIDIRRAKTLAKGLVPGSISAPYSWFRGPKQDPGQPPSAETLARTIGLSGIDKRRPVVIVNHRGDPYNTGQAAYIYWLLKSAGVEKLAVLKGGFTAWQKADMPIAYKTASVRPYRAEVRFRRDWWAGPMDIYGIATEQVPGALLDARPHSFFERLKKAGKIATTLPRAEHMPLAKVGKILSSDVSIVDGIQLVTDAVQDKGILLDKDLVVSFCSTGEFAALNWFYLSELAGVGNVRLYPESAKGWAHNGGLLTNVSQRFFE